MEEDSRATAELRGEGAMVDVVDLGFGVDMISLATRGFRRRWRLLRVCHRR